MRYPPAEQLDFLIFKIISAAENGISKAEIIEIVNAERAGVSEDQIRSALSALVTRKRKVVSDHKSPATYKAKRNSDVLSPERVRPYQVGIRPPMSLDGYGLMDHQTLAMLTR